MRRLGSSVISVMLLSVVLLMSGCATESVASSAPQLQPKLSPPVIGKEKVLRVGVSFQNPPFSIQTDNELQGIDVDLAGALGQELGLTVAFVDIGANGGVDELEAQLVDVVMAGTADDSAGKNVTVVGRYLDNASGLFTKTSNGEPALATQQDINQAIVAVQGGSVTEELVKRLFPTAKLLQLRSVNECFDAVSQDKAKYVACDSFAGAYLSLTYENLAYAGSLDIPSAMGVIVSSDNTQLQKAVQSALDTLNTNGVLRAIRTKWVGNMPQLSTETQILTPQERAKATDGQSVEASGARGVGTEQLNGQSNGNSPTSTPGSVGNNASTGTAGTTPAPFETSGNGTSGNQGSDSGVGTASGTTNSSTVAQGDSSQSQSAGSATGSSHMEPGANVSIPSENKNN